LIHFGAAGYPAAPFAFCWLCDLNHLPAAHVPPASHANSKTLLAVAF
jgi:hypothetical protein